MTDREKLLIYYFCQQLQFKIKKNDKALSIEGVTFHENKEAQFKEYFSNDELEELEYSRRRMWEFHRELFSLTESKEFKQAVQKQLNS